MGNTTGVRRSNSKNDAAVTEAAASRRVVVTSRKLRRRHDVVDGEEQTKRAGRRGRGGGASGAGGDDGGVAPVAGMVVTVRLVMTRKDAETLAARLDDAQRQSARARKARMTELKGELRAGGGGASPASCRDACWSPQLAPIKES